MENKVKKGVFGILFFLILSNVLVWKIVWDLDQIRFLEVVFFDVGQGEAILIKTPKRHQILIDGGPNSIILEKLTKEIPFWDKTIDLVILTHPENDHLLGILEVLKRYKIENILWTGVVRETPEYKEWLNLIEKERANIKIAQKGEKIIAGNVFIEILYPFESLENKKLKDSNDSSIVAKLIFNENSFLFTGDIYKSTEESLILKNSEISSDILKIAHHGSKTSNKKEFIEKVSPEIAVISVGKNNFYGHPHQEVLDVLEECGIKVLRTDKNGDIKIISDGKNYALSSF